RGTAITGFERPEGIQFWAPPRDLAVWPVPVITDADGRFTLHGIGRDQPVGLLVQDDRFAMQLLDVAPGERGQDGMVTRSLEPARLIEGVVTAADSGKPLAGARVVVDARPGPFIVAGDFADWKGRRHVGRGYGFYDHFELFSPVVLTDAQGRFRVNPFVGSS